MGDRDNEPDSDKILDMYVHDYMVKWNRPTSAEALARAAKIPPGYNNEIVDVPGGLLLQSFRRFWFEYYSEVVDRIGHGTMGHPSSPPKFDMELARLVVKKLPAEERMVGRLLGIADGEETSPATTSGAAASGTNSATTMAAGSAAFNCRR